MTEKSVLEKAQHAFSYRWYCEENACPGHSQTIVDWEIGQAYRSWRRKGYEPVDAIREKWLERLCGPDRETLFFVGDQHTRPGQFLVLGVFYPKYRPNANQLSFELALA